MVLEVITKLSRYSGNRHSVYLPTDLVHDSAFPFDPGEEIQARIDEDEGRVILEPTDGGGS